LRRAAWTAKTFMCGGMADPKSKLECYSMPNGAQPSEPEMISSPKCSMALRMEFYSKAWNGLLSYQ
jgi:hypothetical protein